MNSDTSKKTFDPSKNGMHIYDGEVYNRIFPAKVLKKIRNEFEFRDDDLVLSTYPKSGTTWMGQILNLVRAGGSKEAAQNFNMNAIPYLDMHETKEELPNIDTVIAELESPRIMKGHLQAKFFKRALDNSKTKFVIVMRNVKDALVSFYHFYKTMPDRGGAEIGTFADFVNQYKDGYIPDWFTWNLSWWEYRDHPNVCIFKYEDMKRDLPAELRRLAVFTGTTYSEELIDTICEGSSFKTMHTAMSEFRIKEPHRPQLTRKGVVGDWKSHFTEDVDGKYFDDRYKEEMEPTGLTFEFE